MAQIEVGGGLKTAFQLHGDGDETVMLVHGLGFSGRAWKAQVEALVSAGFGVVVPDLRGFGGSDMPVAGYTIAELAMDLEAVRSHIGADRVHLVGHSMGGMVALRYVLTYPARVSSLFVASTTSHNGRRARAFAQTMSKLSTRGFDAAKADPSTWEEVERILATVMPVTGPVLHILEKLTKRPHPARARAWDAIASFSVKDEVARVTQPTVVMHGTADANIPYANGRLLAEGIATAELLTIEGGAHDLPIDHAEAFNDALLSHLAGRQPPSAPQLDV